MKDTSAPPMLYEVVRDACKRADIGPAELARRCGLAREALVDITSHRRRTVAPHVFSLLARETGIPREELVGTWERFDAWLNGVDPPPAEPARCATCDFERTPGGAVCFVCGSGVHRLRTA